MCQRSRGLIQSAEWLKTQRSSPAGCAASGSDGAVRETGGRAPPGVRRSQASASQCWVTAVTNSSSLLCPNDAADSNSPPAAIIASVALLHIASCFFLLLPFSLPELFLHQSSLIIILPFSRFQPSQPRILSCKPACSWTAGHQMSPMRQAPDLFSINHCYFIFNGVKWSLGYGLVSYQKLGALRQQASLFSPKYELCVSLKRIQNCWYETDAVSSAHLHNLPWPHPCCRFSSPYLNWSALPLHPSSSSPPSKDHFPSSVCSRAWICSLGML